MCDECSSFGPGLGCDRNCYALAKSVDTSDKLHSHMSTCAQCSARVDVLDICPEALALFREED